MVLTEITAQGQSAPVLLDSEIVEERSAEHLCLKVLAPGGWVAVTHIVKTIPFPVWILHTPSHSLRGAAKHLVITIDGKSRRLDQLSAGDLVLTASGPETVTCIENTGEVESLYDIRVDSDDHVYYSNGIASHNSTGIGAAEMFKLNTLRGYHSLYIAPLKEHVKTFADRLMNMQRGSVFPPEYILAKRLRNNMYYKESAKGGSFKLLNVLTDPTKIRGNSTRTCVVDEAQDMDPEHLEEINQAQKAYGSTKYNIFAGTSKDRDTLLQMKFDEGSGGVWHIPCKCKDKWHSLLDAEILPKMMHIDGLRCPNTRKPLRIESGQFVHASPRLLEMNNVSFHLPQLIVPQYAYGSEFAAIWKDFKAYPYPKFLREVMGIATEAGQSELSMDHLKNCCSDKTFDKIQADYFAGRGNYVALFSGCDWGGSDWNQAARTKLSYTVHSIWGLLPDGRLELVYAFRYAGMNYMEIAGCIADAHLKFKCHSMGTDNGGGQYYNAYMRDCGKIPFGKIIQFNYSDVKTFMERIPHPEATLMSLHRTDSISALIGDVKNKKLIFPRWDDAAPFATDFLNMRRNITEIPNSGRTIMRYIRPGSKADDFMQSTNYACMMKRIYTGEPTIPNRQLLAELSSLLGNSYNLGSGFGGGYGGGFVSG